MLKKLKQKIMKGLKQHKRVLVIVLTIVIGLGLLAGGAYYLIGQQRDARAGDPLSDPNGGAVAEKDGLVVGIKVIGGLDHLQFTPRHTLNDGNIDNDLKNYFRKQLAGKTGYFSIPISYRIDDESYSNLFLALQRGGVGHNQQTGEMTIDGRIIYNEKSGAYIGQHDSDAGGGDWIWNSRFGSWGQEKQWCIRVPSGDAEPPNLNLTRQTIEAVGGDFDGLKNQVFAEKQEYLVALYDRKVDTASVENCQMGLQAPNSLVADGTSYNPGDTIYLSWNKTVDGEGINAYKYAVSRRVKGSDFESPFVFRDYTADPPAGRPNYLEVWDIINASGIYEYRIQAVSHPDLGDEVEADGKNGEVIVEITVGSGGPPTVTPTDGATNVSVSTNVTATFSEDVSGVNGDSFYLRKDKTSNNIAATVIYDNGTKKATLDPNTNLEKNTKYNATITNAVISGGYNWSFTTGTGQGGGGEGPGDDDVGGDYAPQSFSARNGDGTVHLSWKAPKTTTGLDKYHLQKTISGQIKGNWYPNSNTLKWDDYTNLVYGKEHIYKLWAVYDDSSEVKATNDPRVTPRPPTPTDLKVTEQKDKEIVLDWEPGKSSGAGAASTLSSSSLGSDQSAEQDNRYYKVYRSDTNESDASKKLDASESKSGSGYQVISGDNAIQGSTYTDKSSDLENGKKYFYKVQEVAFETSGSLSNSTSGTPEGGSSSSEGGGDSAGDGSSGDGSDATSDDTADSDTGVFGLPSSLVSAGIVFGVIILIALGVAGGVYFISRKKKKIKK